MLDSVMKAAIRAGRCVLMIYDQFVANILKAYSVGELLMLAYESVGVIYGDIGTSPLYVFSSTFYNPPSRVDIRGALSLIIWSLTVIVTLKYVLIVLRADNDGEGGTFSAYSLLSRYVCYCHDHHHSAATITHTNRQTSRITIHVMQQGHVNQESSLGASSLYLVWSVANKIFALVAHKSMCVRR